MLVYANPNWYYQLAVEKFRVYLQTENQLHSPIFSGHFAKICKLAILCTLPMPGYAHSKLYYQLVRDFDVYLHAKNKLYHSLLSWDITF